MSQLSPRTGKPQLQLKNGIGRPPKRSLGNINDPVACALDEADLNAAPNAIGNRLREPNVDPLVVSWCAERLDPASPRAARFIMVPPAKRRDLKRNFARGRMIDEKLRALGYYDGKKVLNRVLNSIAKKRGTSRSTARRHWVSYCEFKNKKRGLIRTQ